MATYMYTLTPKNNRQGSNRQSVITVKNGHLAWFLKERTVTGSRLSIRKCRRVQAFLASRGYPEMVPVATEEFDGVATVPWCAAVTAM